MGMNFHLETENGDKSKEIELAIVGYIALKHPDEARDDLVDWIEFIAKHSGYHIRLVDSRGRETAPAHVNGGYTIGIADYDPNWKPKVE